MGDRSMSSMPAYASSGGFGTTTLPLHASFKALTESLAERGYSVREQLPLPSKPPFTVHLGNVSFDSTEGDIHDFFGGCEVTSVRIVEDKLDRKPKGFAYAEFATLDGLKKALDLSGTQFQGRNIRITVADPRKSTSFPLLILLYTLI